MGTEAEFEGETDETGPARYFTSNEKFTVWNALYVAKQRFKDDEEGARKLASEALERGEKSVAEGWERIAEQFVKQQEEVRALIHHFD